MPKTSPERQVRWLIRKDMNEVLNIERCCFDVPWAEGDFFKVLKRRNAIGCVTQQSFGQPIEGFMIYELHRSQLRILNIAVDPLAQRDGVGQQMIDRLKGKLTQQRRRSIEVLVRDDNLPAQLFFRSQAFRAVQVLQQPWDEFDVDGYLMRFELPTEPSHSNAAGPVNRIFGGAS